MSTKSISKKYIFVVNATDDYFEPCWDGGASMWSKSYKDADKVEGFNSFEEAVEWWDAHKDDYEILFDRFTTNKNSLIKIETVHKETDMSKLFNKLCTT